MNAWYEKNTDPAFKRRLRRLKEAIQMIPGDRLHEVENFIFGMFPQPDELSGDPLIQQAAREIDAWRALDLLDPTSARKQ